VKDGRAGTVEMSAKNICLIGGTGLSILVALFARTPCGRSSRSSRRKTFLRGWGAKKSCLRRLLTRFPMWVKWVSLRDPEKSIFPRQVTRKAGNEASVPAEFGSLVGGGVILWVTCPGFAPRWGSVCVCACHCAACCWGLGGRGTRKPLASDASEARLEANVHRHTPKNNFHSTASWFCSSRALLAY